MATSSTFRAQHKSRLSPVLNRLNSLPLNLAVMTIWQRGHWDSIAGLSKWKTASPSVAANRLPTPVAERRWTATINASCREIDLQVWSVRRQSRLQCVRQLHIANKTRYGPMVARRRRLDDTTRWIPSIPAPLSFLTCCAQTADIPALEALEPDNSVVSNPYLSMLCFPPCLPRSCLHVAHGDARNCSLLLLCILLPGLLTVLSLPLPAAYLPPACIPGPAGPGSFDTVLFAGSSVKQPTMSSSKF